MEGGIRAGRSSWKWRYFQDEGNRIDI